MGRAIQYIYAIDVAQAQGERTKVILMSARRRFAEGTLPFLPVELWRFIYDFA
jgi:hypothetical protein